MIEEECYSVLHEKNHLLCAWSPSYEDVRMVVGGVGGGGVGGVVGAVVVI